MKQRHLVKKCHNLTMLSEKLVVAEAHCSHIKLSIMVYGTSLGAPNLRSVHPPPISPSSPLSRNPLPSLLP